jgi:hypothetical protein
MEPRDEHADKARDHGSKRERGESGKRKHRFLTY